MRIHIFQHVPFEGPAEIAVWANAKGHPLSITRFYENEAPPANVDFDFLVVMGGPMGAYDEALHPWIAAEKKVIAESIRAGKKVVGICLGAQLIAASLGAKVYPNAQKEIGWFPVTKISEQRLIKSFANEETVFHWHGDTFDLPQGATLLLSSEACRHQAFCLGENVLALQFHLEMDEAAIQSIFKNCGDELVSAPWIQDEKEIEKGFFHITRNLRLLDDTLNSFIQK